MGRVRRLGHRQWRGWVRELVTFTEAETGHRLEWRRILECLSVQYFDVLMVYVTRLYDYVLEIWVETCSQLTRFLDYLYSACYFYLFENKCYTKFSLICQRPTLYLKIKR